ncbi:MAG: histidinol dehydrogenase, partial [Bacteroidota bacterium]
MKIIDIRNFSTIPSGELARPVLDTGSLEGRVADILQTVREQGDEAVRRYSLQFDKVSPDLLAVSSEEIAGAASLLDESLKSAIRQAKDNIEAFHSRPIEAAAPVETMPGVSCWRKTVAIEKVGLYIPGGT